ncbi:MAG: hypothetical protein V9G20_12540 [Candidatus Promineifilaceae bacterium]
MSIKHRVRLLVVTLIVGLFLLGPVNPPHSIGDCPTGSSGTCTG